MDLLTKITNFIMPPMPEDELEEEEEVSKTATATATAAQPATRREEIREQKIVGGAPIEYSVPSYDTPSYEREPESKPSRPQLTVHTTKHLALKIKLYEPDNFDQVSKIADDLKEKKAVIINFDKADAALQRRVCDFVMGVCYVLDGDARRITDSIVLYVPDGIDISDDVAMSLAH